MQDTKNEIDQDLAALLAGLAAGHMTTERKQTPEDCRLMNRGLVAVARAMRDGGSTMALLREIALRSVNQRYELVRNLCEETTPLNLAADRSYSINSLIEAAADLLKKAEHAGHRKAVRRAASLWTSALSICPDGGRDRTAEQYEIVQSAIREELEGDKLEYQDVKAASLNESVKRGEVDVDDLLFGVRISTADYRRLLPLIAEEMRGVLEQECAKAAAAQKGA